MTKVWLVVFTFLLVFLGGCASDGDSYERGSGGGSSHRH